MANPYSRDMLPHVLAMLLIAAEPSAHASPGLEPLHDASLRSAAAMQASTAAARALARMDYAASLAEATRGLAADPADAWLLYDRGCALAGLGRTNEAVESLDRAEEEFARAGDLLGRSVAVYRRALALAQEGRCAEARSSYVHYFTLVRARDDQAAELALARSRTCSADAVRQKVSGKGRP
jgi:tetratricopeptide (TPR) repeat protein